MTCRWCAGTYQIRFDRTTDQPLEAHEVVPDWHEIDVDACIHCWPTTRASVVPSIGIEEAAE